MAKQEYTIGDHNQKSQHDLDLDVMGWGPVKKRIILVQQ